MASSRSKLRTGLIGRKTCTWLNLEGSTGKAQSVIQIHCIEGNDASLHPESMAEPMVDMTPEPDACARRWSRVHALAITVDAAGAYCLRSASFTQVRIAPLRR